MMKKAQKLMSRIFKLLWMGYLIYWVYLPHNALAYTDSIQVKTSCLLLENDLEYDIALAYFRKSYVYVASDSTGNMPDYTKGIFHTLHQAAGFYSDNSFAIKDYEVIHKYIVEKILGKRFSKEHRNLELHPQYRDGRYDCQYGILCGKFTFFYLGDYEFYLPPMRKGDKFETKRVIIPHYLILDYVP